MNERIVEFVRQAWLYADKHQTTQEQWFYEYNKKLADLIVRECIKIVEYKGNKSGKDHPVGFNLLDAAQDIKEHFGVEE
jgi:hypothetical protein